MKKFIALTVIALALTGCAAKEEVVEPVVVEETAPAAEVPADAQVVSGEVSSSEPAMEPAVVYPAEEPAEAPVE